jgi:hypothetical protein
MTRAKIVRALIAEPLTIGEAYGRVAKRLGLPREAVVAAYCGLMVRVNRLALRRDVRGQ